MSAISVKKEVLLSLAFRIGGMIIALLTTSLLIRTLGATNYGIWATLISLLAWIQLSDFGVGYALKNRIAASTNTDQLVDLVSGVFQFFVLMSIGLALVFLLVGGNLKIVQEHPREAWVLYLATFVFFPLTIGISVLQGLHKNSISAAIGFAQSACWFICVVFATWFAGTLHELILAYIAMIITLSLIQYVLAMSWLATKKVNWIGQLLHTGNIKLAFPLWRIGLRFIVLQLSSVVLFSLGTYLTYSNLSAAEAAKFDVMFKFFQVPLTVFNIIISVYWVEIAQGISLKDSASLVARYKQLLLLSLAMSLLILVFAIAVMPPLIDAYSGHKIQCTPIESIAFGMLISIQVFAYSGAVFLNAAEILKGQIYLAIIAAMLLIPVASFLLGRGVGIASVPLATMLLIIPSLIYCNWAAYIYVIKEPS